MDRVDEASRAVLRRVVEQMRADPAVLEGVVTAARAGSPPVAALPAQEVRRHIAALLGVVSAAFIDHGGLAREQAQTAARLAADRAVQGVPLAALLDGFLAGRTEVFRSLADRLRGSGVPSETVLEALIELDSYAGELQGRLIAAYSETELALAGSRSARLKALRELLVLGAVEQAAAAGLAPGGGYHCSVTDIGDPRRAQRAAAALTPPGGVSGLVEGHLCVLARPRATPPSEADAAAGAGADAGWLVVGAPAVPVHRLPAAYRLCRTALDSARRRGLSGRVRLTDLACALAVDGAPAMGELLGGDLLAALDPADGFHRLLAETALTYLDHGSRVDLTARALHVHPNTVKHRLRRLAHLTAFGRPAPSGEALADAFRWHWALESWLA